MKMSWAVQPDAVQTDQDLGDLMVQMYVATQEFEACSCVAGGLISASVQDAWPSWMMSGFVKTVLAGG
jgi:hypothetical protein